MTDGSTPALDIAEEDRKRRQELYDKHSSQAWTDQQASSDSFDNNLLTFSSAALGLSLAFIKNVVPLAKAVWLVFLYLSWVSFAICILVTIASFQFGIQAQKSHFEHLRKYYLDNDSAYLNKKTGWTVAIAWCSVLGSAFFVSGLVSTLTFVYKNVQHVREEVKMSKDFGKDKQYPRKSGTLDARAPAVMTDVTKGLLPATNAGLPRQEERGRGPSKMTPLPTHEATPAVPANTEPPRPKENK